MLGDRLIFTFLFLEQLLFHDLSPKLYFPGDPLHDLDPIMQGIADVNGRKRLIAEYAHDVTTPVWALGYRFDIVLNGSRMTPFETKES